MITESRHLTLTISNAEDLTACLAWILQKHDREFATAEFVKIEIGQLYQVGAEAGTGHHCWGGSISGHIGPKEGRHD